jgi:lipoprotein-releasing system permease protein
VNTEDDIQQQNFTLVGTYKTELEEYDEKFIFVHLAYLQQFGGWGLQGQIVVDTATVPLLTFISPVGFGNNGEFEQHWLDGTPATEPFWYSSFIDTTFGLITTAPYQIPDTTYVHLTFPPHGENEYVTPKWTYSNLRGSEVNYIGGYEVQVENFEALERVRDPLWEAIPYDLFVIPLTDRNPEIFAWLEMLDVNVIIIVVLMVVLSIVNMTSALLILILERQSFIGTLKSMGLPNPILLRVFLWHAAHIIGKGVLIGNILGVGLALFQKYTGVFKLDPTNYYVSEIPILMNPMEIIVLNAITLCVCVLAMILPSLYVSTFRPAESIRKN